MRHRTVKGLIFISIILLCGSCNSVPQIEKSESNSEPVTAILGAFEREVTLLEDQLTERKEQRIEGIRFVQGKLNGEEVVVAWTGIGRLMQR